MKLSKKQKAVIYGLILGDGYLQPTGKQNARMRLEHSRKQERYMLWLYEQLKNIFVRRPARLARIHPKTQRIYHYLRLQSNSSPHFGKLRRKFYGAGGQRIVPEAIRNFLESPLTLAVWYMDDGYYYGRDKSAHFYLPSYGKSDRDRLVAALRYNFSVNGSIHCRPDRKSCQLTINGNELQKFKKIIQPYLIPSMRYKLPLTP